MTKAICKLDVAIELGQPVHGTSAGSIYVCCLIGHGFNMALRNNSNSLSLRVEPNKTGHDFPVSKLKKLGFGSGKPTEYMSQHFSCEGGSLATCGAYGAIIEQTKYLFDGEVGVTLDWKALENAGT